MQQIIDIHLFERRQVLPIDLDVNDRTVIEADPEMVPDPYSVVLDAHHFPIRQVVLHSCADQLRDSWHSLGHLSGPCSATFHSVYASIGRNTATVNCLHLTSLGEVSYTRNHGRFAIHPVATSSTTSNPENPSPLTEETDE
jgi:hypothetical protein